MIGRDDMVLKYPPPELFHAVLAGRAFLCYTVRHEKKNRFFIGDVESG
jgi:hypothetical protein